MRRSVFAFLLSMATLQFGYADAAQQNRLIPRQDFFGASVRSSLKISPDGTKLCFTAPLDGTRNIFVTPVTAPNAAKPITHAKGHGISGCAWTQDGSGILYTHDDDGSENNQIHIVEWKNGKDRNVTGMPQAKASIIAQSAKFPGVLLVGLNDRDKHWQDVYRLDLKTGERTLVYRNDRFSNFIADEDLKLRFAFAETADGGTDIERFLPDGSLAPYLKTDGADALSNQSGGLIGMNRAGTVLYAVSMDGRDKAALVARDPVTAQETVLAENPYTDIDTDVMLSPKTGDVQAYAETYSRVRWIAIDKTIARDIAYLDAHTAGGNWRVVSRSADDEIWLLTVLPADEAPYYALYRRAGKHLTKLYSLYPGLTGKKISPARFVAIRARDGLILPSFLYRPDGKGPHPLVLRVHGGPWGQVNSPLYHYDPVPQWLTNRGYAVLEVNFRGSVHLGKAFIDASNGQWGAAMEDDLIDAKNWAVANGITSKETVAIMGLSYGGYAVLAAMTMHPDEFACGIDMFGPSDLASFINRFPPYWGGIRKIFVKRVGDPQTEAGHATLKARSPLTFAADIRRPLLITQGGNDVRVTPAESETMVEAARRNNQPVTYVAYPDEGHMYRRPENNLSFNAIVEAFLAKHLGGAYQPVENDFSGSSVTVPTGAEQIPGLLQALAAKH